MPISTSLSGFLFGLSAYLLWGFFPLFFHLLREVPSTEVLAHRVIWSFIYVASLLLVMGWYQRVWTALTSFSLLRQLLLSSLLVSFNWLVFIWAVAQGRVVESSLGYFLTPLVSVFLARVFLAESMNRTQLAAIAIASLGIAWLILRLGHLPWVSLGLAISFGLYGLVRKQVKVDTLTGLTVETGLLLPAALVYWVYLGYAGATHFYPASDDYSLLLMASGLVTALPLLLFASATKRLSLSVVGFMMYINPSIQFCVALFVLEEDFNQDQFIGFCFIWLALLIFSLGSLPRRPAMA